MDRYNIKNKLVKGNICYNENPIFILKMGPPGSGKSYIIDSLLGKQKVDKKFLSFNLDEFIENDPIFLSKSREIYERDINNNKKIELVKNLYFDRKVKTKISQKLDEILEKGMKNKCNIIYEVTGRIDTIEWFLRLPNMKNYNSYIIYVYSDLDELKSRVHKRGYDGYIEGKSYRNIKDSNIENIFYNSKKSFNKYKNDIKIIKIKNKTGKKPQIEYGKKYFNELKTHIDSLP